MPPKELLNMVGGNPKYGENIPFSTDPSFRIENDLAELVWDNNQIVTQGQSSRVVELSGVEAILDLSPNGEMIPPFNYSVEDGPQQDHCSEFFPELSAVVNNTRTNIERTNIALPSDNPSFLNISDILGPSIVVPPIQQIDVAPTDQPVIQSNADRMVACSSGGSGNCVEFVSCERTHNLKRKFSDVREADCHIDDIKTKSVGGKKPTPGPGMGSKRSRASEIHNLSERRRRDKINEKMRTLQKLIPNCNKADKASMLDEAIEYLKRLQLEVQMMSMGAGLRMPHMMFPPGFQHMHTTQLPHFPPMGLGMGMGMPFGMGMGMGMQGLHYPCPAPGFTNFPRIPGSNLPPLVPRHPTTSVMGLNSQSKHNAEAN